MKTSNLSGLLLLFCMSLSSSCVKKEGSESQDSVTEASKNCPSGFVEVEGNGILGTNDFCVMKFEAKNNSGTPVSKASGIPWGGINATDAQAACESMSEPGFDGSFTLISNPEWMTIARDIEDTASNWSGGVVGSGHIPRGHSDASPADPIEVIDPLDPYSGTGNNSSELAGSGWEQKRTHTLSNGSVIWDIAGNSYEWVDWDPSDTGFSLGPQDEGASWKELSVNPSGSLLIDDYKPVNDSYGTANSFGQWLGGSGGATLRGGTSDKNAEAGVYTLLLVVSSSTTSNHFGFRCVYRP